MLTQCWRGFLDFFPILASRQAAKCTLMAGGHAANVSERVPDGEAVR